MTPGSPAPDLIRGLRQPREAPDQVRGGHPDQPREAPDQVRGGQPDQVRGGHPDQVRGGHPDQVRGGVASPMRNLKAILTRPRNPLKSLTPDSCPLRALP
jgi:hypothetical protein